MVPSAGVTLPGVADWYWMQSIVSGVERDAADIAADHGGEVVDYGNGEWVVNSRSGEEIARWEIA